MSDGHLTFEDGTLRLTDCQLTEIRRTMQGFSTDMQISGWVPRPQFNSDLLGEHSLEEARLYSGYASFLITKAAVTVSAKGYGDGRGLFVKVRFLHNDDPSDEEE